MKPAFQLSWSQVKSAQKGVADSITGFEIVAGFGGNATQVVADHPLHLKGPCGVGDETER